MSRVIEENSQPKLSINSSKGRLLCDDVLVEILCQLPEKPLVRFKCVSKSWNYLISKICIPRISRTTRPPTGLYFRSTLVYDCWTNLESIATLSWHFFRRDEPTHDSGQGLLYYASLEDDGPNGGDNGIDFSYLPFRPSADDFLDSCNGLLLFINRPTCRYYVCNPVTRQWVPVPKAYCHEKCHHAALAFNPAESPWYKVVCFIGKLTLDIYSSNSGRWIRQRLELDPDVSNYAMMRHCVYSNGALYRFAPLWHVIRYDVNEVSACIIDIPMMANEYFHKNGIVGVLMSQLCYAHQDSSGVLVWSLEGHFKSGKWILKYSLSKTDLTRDLILFEEHTHTDMSCIGLCGFHPTADIIFLSTPDVVLSYDLKSSRLKKVGRTREGLNVIVPGYFFPVVTLARFLVPFDHMGNIDRKSISLVKIPEGAEILSSEMQSDISEDIKIGTRYITVILDDESSNDSNSVLVPPHVHHKCSYIESAS